MSGPPPKFVQRLVSIGSVATAGFVLLLIIGLAFWQTWGAMGRAALFVVGLIDVLAILITAMRLRRHLKRG